MEAPEGGRGGKAKKQQQLNDTQSERHRWRWHTTMWTRRTINKASKEEEEAGYVI